MTAWHIAEITVTLSTDLHCGDRPLGFVSRTYPYVPGHIPWYALVPELVERDRDTSEVSPEEYKIAEDSLKMNLRFTPFFILEEGKNLLWPWNGNQRRTIESQYICSQYGVAISYAERGAKENHLFETETILARSRGNMPTILRGYCFWLPAVKQKYSFDQHGKCCKKSLAEWISGCQWGGQRNKGLGTLKDVTVRVLAEEERIFGCSTISTGEFPIVKVFTDSPAPFFLKYFQELASEIKGNLSPLTGRRCTGKNGYGHRMDPAVVLWDLGWQRKAETIVMFRDYRYCSFIEHG